jgi:peptide/nickel transport system ATP-binding protein
MPASESVPLVELDRVTKTYRGRTFGSEATVALDNVSLTIQGDTAQIVSIVGESGSGKTTLASLLMGFVSPTQGTVRFQGADVSKLRGAGLSRFRQDVQAVFQDPFAVFNPFYKVDHVLTVPIRKLKLARPGAPAKALMAEALEAVGLRPDETLGRYPHQLSGGQRQRIIVARALMLEPKLIVADEPVSMVDASLRATILESLRTVNRTINIPIIYITHDLGTAYHVSDHVLVMYRGSIVEAGAVEQVINSPTHPYTRLLIDSIPWPDPRQQWGSAGTGEQTSRIEVPGRHSGCRFAERCPSAMPRCLEDPPPLYDLGNDQATRCYLHDTKPILHDSELSRLLEGASGSSAGDSSRRPLPVV